MNNKVEFGDFQTPQDLAELICRQVSRSGFSPASIVEPSCGAGAFLVAAINQFPNASHFLGVDRNEEYVQLAKTAVNHIGGERHIQILHSDFFNTKWQELLTALPKPILILGNPPWVTNAAQGAFGGTNLPQKVNSQNLRGIDALTGKSNFDISEWMIRQSLEWFGNSSGMVAVLCKTTVARKVLLGAWSHHRPIVSSEIRRIDARHYFDAAVDACLLMMSIQPGASSAQVAGDYETLAATAPNRIFGLREGMLIADIPLFEQRRNLLGQGLSGWRSGIKHDCSSVFELVSDGEDYKNKQGMDVAVEEAVVFPLLKSSDLAKNQRPRKWLLVPQRTVGEPPELLQLTAPKAWSYLSSNSALLAKRASSIYRNRPAFSIFGVGDYSFSPWKVGISGLYKKLDFVPIPPYRGRPVVLDDTCYFFACETEAECNTLYKLVTSRAAQEFWSSLIFWDAKRPITSQILNLLDLKALAQTLGMMSDVAQRLAERQVVSYQPGVHQPLLFRENSEGFTTN